MPSGWDRDLSRWQAAGLIDSAAADRIREFESQSRKASGFRWPIVLALALGALLLTAGILLFVSSYWDELSPVARLTLVVFLVAVFHLGGALASTRFPALGITLHTVGTIALGAGIALTGQIFNLAEHWPSGIMLWAAGAVLGWAVLRHWTQATLASVLIPAWLVSEWASLTAGPSLYDAGPAAAGVCLLAFTYFSAQGDDSPSPLRRALVWIGGLALIPSVLVIFLEGSRSLPDRVLAVTGWSLAFVLPLAVAFLLRGRASWMNAVSAVWVAVAAIAAELLNGRVGAFVYLWCAVGASGLAAWGVWENRKERVNLGVAGFAITVLTFYFSSVMDKMDRSVSLIGLGFLFLAGGWALEKTRRRLIGRMGASR